MKEFKVAVTYSNWGIVTVEAKDMDELKEKLKDREFIDEMPLPDEPEYVECSYEIDEDFAVEEI